MNTFTFQALRKDQINTIHEASVNLLKQSGIVFDATEAMTIFKNRGLRTDGKTVFFTEANIARALETTPKQFTLMARNPVKSIEIGGNQPVFAPGYGARFIVGADGEKRRGVMEDYDTCCKLIQTSDVIDVNGFMMVEPSDVSPETAHLDMIYSNIILSDKPFMGSPVSGEGMRDCLEMASIVWGGKNNIRNKPVMIALINSLSPLSYSRQMTGAMIELAKYGQPCIVSPLIVLDNSTPWNVKDVLTAQNAEILAGIVLTQLINPGTPVVYGSTLSRRNPVSGDFSISVPEMPRHILYTAQLAHFYGLPSRGGGSLTDARRIDSQSGVESSVSLVTAFRCGIDFILHACGLLNSFIFINYEKFVIDEHICRLTRQQIESVGATHKKGDVFFESILKDFSQDEFRREHGDGMSVEMASEVMSRRLAAYEKPDIDPEIESDLSQYVTNRKYLYAAKVA